MLIIIDTKKLQAALVEGECFKNAGLTDSKYWLITLSIMRPRSSISLFIRLIKAMSISASTYTLTRLLFATRLLE